MHLSGVETRRAERTRESVYRRLNSRNLQVGTIRDRGNRGNLGYNPLRARDSVYVKEVIKFRFIWSRRNIATISANDSGETKSSDNRQKKIWRSKKNNPT